MHLWEWRPKRHAARRYGYFRPEMVTGFRRAHAGDAQGKANLKPGEPRKHNDKQLCVMKGNRGKKL